MERSFEKEVRSLRLGAGDTFHGEGILAITKALLQSGVSYVGGYQGAPALAYQRGNRPEAVKKLTAALAGFKHADMALYREAARERLGCLLGGERGKEMQAEAKQWLLGEGAVRPDALLELAAPGFGGEEKHSTASR